MKIAHADWPYLRSSARLLGLSLLLGGALGGAAWHDLGQARQAAAQARRDRLAIATRLDQVRQEEADLRHYTPRFTALQTQGVIGEERRLDWNETVIAALRRSQGGAAQYRLHPQDALSTPGGIPLAHFALRRSAMQLKLQTRHEESLLQTLDGLREGNALVLPQSCRLARQEAAADGPAATSASALLSADCQIDWITLQPPAEARP